MDKGIQNSVFFQNAANFPNFEYDVQRIYQQLARPVLCPIMAIPQDMLCNFQGFGNLPPCVNSREKVLKSSVQKVFISSTSCFQSYKPQRKNRVSSIDLKKDAAVLTSKQNIENITQKRDIGTPTSRLDTPSRNVQYLYKKRCGDSLIDAEYENDYEEYNNTIDRDMRLKQLLKNLLAAKRREKQIARYSRLKKLQKYRSQNDPDLSSDENYEISNDKKGLKEINAYYVNCDNSFANPRQHTGNNVKKTLRKSFPCKQYTRNKHPLCYPMSSQGRKMIIQKEREAHQKKVQAPETTTCDSTCECHDFNYYNNKIRSIIAKYGESFECDKICSSANHSKTHEKKSNFSTYESFMQDKMDKAKFSMKNLQNPYPTCGCFQNDSSYTEASSATATTDEQQEINQRNMNNQQGRQESVLDSKLQCDESIKDNLVSKPEQHDVSTQDGYFQNICDGVKSDSFPYLCSCFKKKKVNDKAILARNCCNNIVKSHAAQTESAVQSVDDSVQTQSIKDTNVQKKDVGYSWILNDNPNFQFKEAPKTAKDIEKESNPKVKHAGLNTESPNNRLEPTSTKTATDIKENTNLKVKNAGLGTTDDTIKEIHKEKLQAIFEKYIDDKMPLTKYTLPNIFGDNEGIINNNFQKNCESICEQIHQQKREMWQLSNQGKEPNEFLLNIMERLDELTKLINSYVKESHDSNCCTLRQSSAQKPGIKSNYWNFSMQQSNRLQKLDADTNSSAIAMKHAETQLDSTQKIILQNETSKIKQMKKDVEDIVNDIIKKVNVVSSGLGNKTQSLKTDGFIPKCLEKPIKYNQAGTSSQRKMTIAVNTDQLGLVSLLKMSTEALMRLLSYFPMVSSNPVFGTAYKQSVSHYVCNVCGAIFQKSSQLSDHIEEKHNLDQIRDCCICRHTLELQQHPVTGLYTCQYCGRHFTRAYCCDLHQKGCAKRHGVTPEVHSSLALLR